MCASVLHPLCFQFHNNEHRKLELITFDLWLIMINPQMPCDWSNENAASSQSPEALTGFRMAGWTHVWRKVWTRMFFSRLQQPSCPQQRPEPSTISPINVGTLLKTEELTRLSLLMMTQRASVIKTMAANDLLGCVLAGSFLFCDLFVWRSLI